MWWALPWDCLHLGAGSRDGGRQSHGILGMLVFIPLCSVLYALLRQLTVHRLCQRRVPAEKWREPPKK